MSWSGLSARDRDLGKLDNTTSIQISVQSQHTFQISTVIAVNFSSEPAGSSVGPLIPNYHYTEFHYCGISWDKHINSNIDTF